MIWTHLTVPRIIDATAVFLQLLWPNPERYSEHAVPVRVWTVWCVQIDSFLVVIPRNSLPEAAFTVTTPIQLSSIAAELCRAGVVSLSCGGLKIKRLICCSSQSPGEIERREVSWTFTKKLDSHLRVQARSRGGRWCWTLKLAQKRS